MTVMFGVFTSFISVLFADDQIKLGIESSTFLGGQGSLGTESLTLNGLTLSGAGEKKEILKGLDAKGSFDALVGFSESKYRFFESKEAFLKYTFADSFWNQSSKVTLSVGREKDQFSLLDENFGLGITQGQFQWDYLSPSSVGLTAAQLELKVSSEFRIKGIFSPLFIPNRGAPLEFKNGKLTSVMPWSINPPDSVVFQNQPIDIQYQADIPPTKQLIQQTTLGGLIEYRSKDTLISLSGFYKPMNNVLLSYEPYYHLDTNTANVTLFPRVSSHVVLAANLEKDFFSFSVVHEQPKDKPPIGLKKGMHLLEYGDVSSTRTSQMVTQSTLISPEVHFTILKNQPFESRFSISALKRFGSELPDQGDQSDGETSFFDRHIRFSEAIQFKTASTLFSENTLLQLKALFDLKNPSSLVSTDLKIQLEKHLDFFTRLSILTDYSKDSKQSEKGFIQKMAANDLFVTGFHYVF